ncbi:unnamed protein product [Trichobilharzia szidati]|nr:unnamed protein product [Trichobilharzia szidati]
MLLREHAHGIDLHINLGGSVRPKTLFELSQTKMSNSPNTLTEFEERLLPRAPYSAEQYTKSLSMISPLISGKKEVLARICHEFVEDCVQLGGLCYVETRFCPFALNNAYFNAEEAIQVILDTFNRAGAKNKIEVRSILTIMADKPETADRTLALAKRYQTHGVVGINCACGDEILGKGPIPKQIVKTFQDAKNCKIHRTVDVGCKSSAQRVYEAVTALHAERIAHGYQILENENLYQYITEEKVHFEMCPSTSVMTGAIDMKNPKNHPIHQFLKDKIRFSINADCPTLSRKWSADEAEYCMNELAVKPISLAKANLNAAKAAFCTQEERHDLITHARIRTRNRIVTIK